jgi:hypothetical protein
MTSDEITSMQRRLKELEMRIAICPRCRDVVPPDALEEWRSCGGGDYEVSSFGNIRRATPGISTFVGRPLKPVGGSTGYAQVQLGDRRIYVHHLVAEAFIGPRPDGHVINHKDANKRNNAAANLEYVTPKENSAHANALVPRPRGPNKPPRPLKGKQVGDLHWARRMPDRIARGEGIPHAKLTDATVREIRRRVDAGETQAAVARDVGISVAQMSRIVRGLRWKHVA